MAFKPGHAKIPGSGIKKGQKIKSKETAKEIFVRVMGKEPIQAILDELQNVSPKERMKVFVELLPYMTPKLAATVTADLTKDNIKEDLLKELEALDESGVKEADPITAH